MTTFSLAPASHCSTSRPWCWRRLRGLAAARLVGWLQRRATATAERRALILARDAQRARRKDLPHESAYHATMQELWRSGRPEERRR